MVDEGSFGGGGEQGWIQTATRNAERSFLPPNQCHLSSQEEGSESDQCQNGTGKGDVERNQRDNEIKYITS